MKLKFRFPGMLRHVRKQFLPTHLLGDTPADKRQAPYIFGLLLLWLFVFLFGTFKCNAATTDTLKIGDKMPDIVLTNIINSGPKTVRLSDLKGKLVLIDFWSTWCSSCIKAFPELDSLQRLFPDKLKIYLVNPQRYLDTKRTMQLTLDRINAWSSHRLKLGIVFQDTAITKYISLESIPTTAWVGPDGRLLAVTDGSEVNADRIREILSGGMPKLKITPPYQTHLKPKKQ